MANFLEEIWPRSLGACNDQKTHAIKLSPKGFAAIYTLRSVLGISPGIVSNESSAPRFEKGSYVKAYFKTNSYAAWG
jgi:hypothetical protein